MARLVNASLQALKRQVPSMHLCGWVASQRLYTSLFGGR